LGSSQLINLDAMVDLELFQSATGLSIKPFSIFDSDGIARKADLLIMTVTS